MVSTAAGSGRVAGSWFSSDPVETTGSAVVVFVSFPVSTNVSKTPSNKDT